MSVPPTALNALSCFPGSPAEEQVFCSGRKAHPTVSAYCPAAPGAARPAPGQAGHPYSELFQQRGQSSLFLNLPPPAAAARATVSPLLRGCPQSPQRAWLLLRCQGSGQPLTVFDERYMYLQAMNTCCDKIYKTREIKLHRLLFQPGIMTSPASAG